MNYEIGFFFVGDNNLGDEDSSKYSLNV